MTGKLIRPAVAADLPHIVELERASATAPHWAAADYAAILEPHTSPLRRCLFIASDPTARSALLGFAAGRLLGDEAELESVAVVASAQRRGLGTALCQAVLCWAREAGAHTLELEVRAESAGAIRLYTGLGFISVGRRAAYYSAPPDDALLLRLGLLSAPAEGHAAGPSEAGLDV